MQSTLVHSPGWCNPSLHVTAGAQCRGSNKCKTSEPCLLGFRMPAGWHYVSVIHPTSGGHARRTPPITHPLLPWRHLGLYGLMYHISHDRSCPTHCKCMEALFRPVFLCSRPANLAAHEYWRYRVVSSSGSQSAIRRQLLTMVFGSTRGNHHPPERHELALLGTPRCQTARRDVLVIGAHTQA